MYFIRRVTVSPPRVSNWTRSKPTKGFAPTLAPPCCEANPAMESSPMAGEASPRWDSDNSIREAEERHLQAGGILGQVLKNLDASGNYRRLQLRNFSILHPSGIGEATRGAAYPRRQASVGVNLNVKAIGFSDHGCWQSRRRTLPGNPDNSRDRPCKGAHYAVLYRWCSIFHKCTALRANHTACRR